MLGVLGGMGPQATLDFLAKLTAATPAERDQQHLPMIVCSTPDIPDRSDAILGHGANPFPAMRTALRRLERAGARHVAIPCNTAHHWHERLQATTRLPILHIVDAVLESPDLQAALLDRAAGSRDAPLVFGLLATTGAVAAEIYPRRLSLHGIPCLVPCPDGQAEVMTAIRNIKAGELTQARTMLRAQAMALLDRGCTHVVMGCTEIPLALDAIVDAWRPALIDATQALVQACIRQHAHEVQRRRSLRRPTLAA